jgi:hypothetical protein
LDAWKAAGHPADGHIDAKTFNTRGEHTGSAREVEIPTDRLASAAQRSAKGILAGHAFGDGREETLNLDAIKAQL